jgi:poly(A) polymerase
VYRIVLENLIKCCKSYPAELFQALLRTAEENGVRMYLVGGTVRDCLLGRISHDLDITVSGRVLSCAQYLRREVGGGTLIDLSGPDDEAVRLVWRGEQVDLAAFRAGVKTIEEDLRLRDFTVNAMAMELSLVQSKAETAASSRSLLDPTGGLEDLRQGRVRHCPGAFAADPVRMLRGYRMCAVLGFLLDQKTKAAIARDAALIEKTAAERISCELQLIFDSPRTTETLRDMAETGLLRRLLPELYQGEGVEQPEFHHLDVLEHCFLALQMMETVIAEPERFFPGHGIKITGYLQEERVVRCLKWAALMHDVGKPVTKEIRFDKDDRVTFYGHDEVGRELFLQFADRSKWSKADAQLVGSLIAMHMHPFHLCNVQREEPVSKRAALKLCRRAEKSLIGLFLLAMSDSLASLGEKKPERMEEELLTLFATVDKMYAETIAPVLHGPRLLTGRDLIGEFHLIPGPLFAEILEELEVARVEGKVIDRTTALAWVDKYLNERVS